MQLHLFTTTQGKINHVGDIVGSVYTNGQVINDEVVRIVDTAISQENLLLNYYYNTVTDTVTQFPTKPTPAHIWDWATYAWVSVAPNPTLSNVVVVRGLRSYRLSFDLTDANYASDFFGVEVYESLTTNFASATLVATVNGGAYYREFTESGNRYLWLKVVWDGGSGSLGSMITTNGDVIETKDLKPGSTSASSFGFSTTGPVGIDINTYTAVVSGSLTNDTDSPLTFYINLFCKQSYSSGAKQTSWLFRDVTLNQTIHTWGVLSNIDQMPSISVVYQIPANTTRVVALYWSAADTTVSLSNLSFQYFGAKR